MNRCSWTDAPNDDYDLGKMRWQSARDHLESIRQGEAFGASLHAASRRRITDSCLPVTSRQRPPLAGSPSTTMSIIRQSSARPAPVAPASLQHFDDAQSPQAGLPAVRDEAAGLESGSGNPFCYEYLQAMLARTPAGTQTVAVPPTPSRSAPSPTVTVPVEIVPATESVQPAHEDARAVTGDGDPTAADRHGPKEHSLSKTTADQHGCPAAVLLKYLDYVVSRRGREKDGRQWYRVNLDDLAKACPYLARSCIEETLKKLTAGDSSPLLVHRDNRHGFDRTGNYAFRTPQLAAESRTSIRYFRPAEAVRHGIPAALLLHNLRHWAGQPDAPADGWQTIPFKKLAIVLPLSSSQIKRAVQTLVTAKVLERAKPDALHRGWRYRLVPDQAVQNGGGEGVGTKADLGSTKADKVGANPDMQSTKADLESTKADNNTGYQLPLPDSVNQSLQQRSNYSMRPAPPRAMSACVSLSTVPGEPAQEGGSCGHPVAPSHERDASPQQEEVSRDQEGSWPRLDEQPRNGSQVHVLDPAIHSGTSPGFAAPRREAHHATEGIGPFAAVSKSPASAPVHRANGAPSPAPLQATAVVAPSIWPPDYTTMMKEASAALRHLDEHITASFEKLFERELQQFLDAHPLDTLEIWMDTRDRQKLYVQFQPLVAALEFPAVKQRDEAVLCLLRKAFMVRLSDVFACYIPGGNHACVPYPYRMGVHIGSSLAPRRKARHEEQRSKFVADRQLEWNTRQQKHQSADAHLEDNPMLSAAAKVKVLENGIISLNQTGVLNDKYETKLNLLRYNRNSLNLAKQFFNLNPTATPGHLLDVMHRCARHVADHPLEAGEFDEHYTLRKGTHLTSLLAELPAIVADAELGDSIPALKPVARETETAD